jgi:Holliday junction resolvase RusA-like endonuclease
MIILRLPYPISINQLYCRSKHGVYLNPLATKYKREVFMLVREQGFKTKFNAFKDTQNIYLGVQVCFPKLKRKRDIDNLIKIIQDSLMFAGVIPDDSQVCEINIKKLTNKEKSTVDGFVDIVMYETDSF